MVGRGYMGLQVGGVLVYAVGWRGWGVLVPCLTTVYGVSRAIPHLSSQPHPSPSGNYGTMSVNLTG